MKTVDQIRLDAADLLMSRPDAWTQGDNRRKNAAGEYCYCLVGACNEVAGYYAAYSAWRAAVTDAGSADAARAAADAADAADAAATAAAACAAANDAAPPLTRAAAWNDAPGRTRDEVVAALRKLE